MRIVLVTGEYPPDVGGTATRAAQLMRLLPERGHQVLLLTLGEENAAGDPPAFRVSRRWPWPARLLAVAWWLVRHRRRYDVVYALSLHTAAAVGSRIARRPLVLYVPGDHAWERARRLGLTDQDFEAFQLSRGGPLRLRAMRALQHWTARQAAALAVPSEHMRAAVQRWTRHPAEIVLVPTGVAIPDQKEAGDSAHAMLRAVFVGRLAPVKRVDLLVEAVAVLESVILEIVGDGPDRTRLEAEAAAAGSPVRFVGALPHADTLRRIAAADVLVLASETENLPNAIVEALACGTPVVAPRVGGIAELVAHDHNGLLVGPTTPQTLREALKRLRDDPALLQALQTNAQAAAQTWRTTGGLDAVCAILRRVVHHRSGATRRV